MNIVKSIVLVITGLNYNVRYNQMLYSFECSIQRLINRFGLYSFRLGYYEFKNTSKKNLVFMEHLNLLNILMILKMF